MFTCFIFPLFLELLLVKKDILVVKYYRLSNGNFMVTLAFVYWIYCIYVYILVLRLPLQQFTEKVLLPEKNTQLSFSKCLKRVRFCFLIVDIDEIYIYMYYIL